LADTSKIHGGDLAEMLVGAVPIAYPLAVTEEVWNLGESITWMSALLLWAGTGVVIGWYGSHAFQAGGFRKNWSSVLIRLGLVQLLTFAVCALLLIVVGKWPIATDPALAIKRTLLVLFPASFSATIVDSFGRRAQA